MQSFDALLMFLAAHTDLFFLVAISAMVANMTVAKKSRRAARIVAIVSLCACVPLFVLYAVASVLRPDLLPLALAALWGWNCWSAGKTWRRTRPWKPVPSRTRPSKPLDRRN